MVVAPSMWQCKALAVKIILDSARKHHIVMLEWI